MIDFLKKLGWLVLDVIALLVLFAIFAAFLVFVVSKALSIDLENVEDALFAQDPYLLLAIYGALLIASVGSAVLVHYSSFLCNPYSKKYYFDPILFQPFKRDLVG